MTDRTAHAYNMRQYGFTYREIGIAVGKACDPSSPVGVERARQLVAKEIRCMKVRARRRITDAHRYRIAAAAQRAGSW